MKDKDKTQKQLIQELTQLRQRIAELEASERERKQAEDKLRESEEELGAIFNDARIGIAIFDKTGKILRVNQRILEIGGYTEKEIVGKRIKLLKMFPSKNMATMVANFSKLMAGKKVPPFDVEVYTKKGEKLTIELHGALLRKKGKVVGMVGIMRDITERKRAEKEIERLAFFPKLNPMPIVEANQKGQLTYANPAAQHLFQDLGKRQDENSFLAGLKPYFSELRKKRKKYVLREVEVGSGWYSQVITLTDQEHIRIYSSEITDRKQAEEELRENEERFRRVVETMEVGLGAIDENGVLTYVNEYLAKMLGYSMDEMIGRPTLDFYYDEESRKAQAEIFAKRRAGMRDPTPYEVTWRRKDGQKVYSILSPTPHFDADGRYTGSFAIHTDITERKQAEALIQVRMRLMEFSATHSLKELLQRTLDEVCEFTNSSVGFYHFVEADQKTLSLQAWSTRTVEEFCTASAEGMHYSIDEAGVWVDCIRERRPVVHNDYASLPHRKGMPEGHAFIVRELVVPIMRNDRFVAILGVGNKPQDYVDQDVQIVSYLADVAWVIAERKRAVEALRESEEKLKNIVENSTNIFYSHTPEHILTYQSPQVKDILGYEPEETMVRWTEFVSDNPINEEGLKLTMKAIETGKPQPPYEMELVHKNGKKVWVEVREAPVVVNGKTISMVGALTDITERKQAEKELKLSYEQLQETLITTVDALTSMVEMKDRYTAGHQPRVAQLACAIAEEMDLAQEQIEGIRMAGLVHDIGKIMVPAEILSKPGPLTDIQYDMVKMHLQAGYDILKGIKFPWPVAQIVLQHHERMDGSGYPQGLKDDKIMLEARILAVANVVEAMTSHRPYREAHDIKEALKEISQHKGVFYDPDAVNACLKLFTKKRFTFT